MNSRNYEYQYDTNPRKIKPEYNSPKRKTDAKKSKKTTAKKPVKNTIKMLMPAKAPRLSMTSEKH